MKDKRMLIGVNTHLNKVRDEKPQYMRISDSADFLVCHVDPYRETLESAIGSVKKAAAILAEKGIDFIANFEYQNFGFSQVSPDGTEWSDNSGDTHKLMIPEKYAETLGKNKNFIGIIYDEFEHAIINRNVSVTLATKGKIKKNVFPVLNGKNIIEQGRLLENQLKEYVSEIKSKTGGYFAGEHVFPVLFHTFAKSGITPNFKSQKESCSDIQFAFAAGAALQYGTELWNCVDCWFRMKNPGHSPDEMYSNLGFAYNAGVNRVYVESTSVFEDKDGNETEYGRKFREFSEKYRGTDRDYDISDYTPETGIIRFDDTYWGQGDPFLWKNMLFGNSRIKPDRRSKEITGIFSLLDHGETSKDSFSWDKISPFSLRKHRSFVSLNSPAVFDDSVTGKCLESLKLCFLTGVHISDETINAVAELAREKGLTVVSPKRFAPDEILKQSHGRYSEVRDGKGLWIVTESFTSSKIKKRISPLLGNKGEIRLTFGEKEVVMKISEDGEKVITVK